ncbi:hypothetical protein GE21DRAFT_1022861 [Neurospora crassa]|nr:hypothetical protein GE21DRAFT_1022861 [Neurospora crassa]
MCGMSLFAPFTLTTSTSPYTLPLVLVRAPQSLLSFLFPSLPFLFRSLEFKTCVLTAHRQQHSNKLPPKPRLLPHPRHQRLLGEHNRNHPI